LPRGSTTFGSDIICPKEVLLFSIILSTKDLWKYCFSLSVYHLMTYGSTAFSYHFIN